VTVYKRKKQATGRISHLCHNHKTCGQVGSHVMVLLGHDTHLCRKCVKEWETAYDSALHPASWERTLCKKAAA
jgi:hypothetical protein